MRLLFCLTLLLLTTGQIFAQSQTEMNIKACNSAKKSEVRMNKLYQQILKEYQKDKVFIAKFKKAQKAWILYRDAEIEAEYPTRPGELYGTVKPMCDCQIFESFVLKRIKELEKWIKGSVCCDVCGPSWKEYDPKNRSKILH